MVNNWNPWGQPGNGAPNVDTRIRNLEMDGLYPANKHVLKMNLRLLKFQEVVENCVTGKNWKIMPENYKVKFGYAVTLD